MVSLTCLPQKHEFKVFIFLLDKTEMAQNNSLFVWKTSNYSLLWGILTTHHSSVINALATRCLYCHNELTAWQVCVVSESKPK